jgi:predicted outer membrane repeat protein
MGLALFFLAALLWGLRGVTPAYADPGTLYVDGVTGSNTTDCKTPATPCATIGYALTQAANSDEIRVAEGTYTETLGIGITVTLKGGYEATGWTRDIAAHPTIVDADGANNQVITIYQDTNVTVEGFTVQGANHTSDVGGGFFIYRAAVVISGTVVRNNSAQSGGGIYVEDATNVSLINNTFTANAAAGGASGVAGGALGYVMIQNTVFTENTGDSVLEFESGQPFEITGGQVVSNTVSGFAVIRFSGSGTISGTAVLSNTSGSVAIATGPSSSVSARGLIVRNNVGGIASSGILTITDSTIENNSGGTRAAVGSENWPETNRLVMEGHDSHQYRRVGQHHQR